MTKVWNRRSRDTPRRSASIRISHRHMRAPRVHVARALNYPSGRAPLSKPPVLLRSGRRARAENVGGAARARRCAPHAQMGLAGRRGRPTSRLSRSTQAGRIRTAVRPMLAALGRHTGDPRNRSRRGARPVVSRRQHERRVRSVLAGDYDGALAHCRRDRHRSPDCLHGVWLARSTSRPAGPNTQCRP